MAKTYQYTQITTRLQNQQILAMRWLASQGLKAEEIRTFRWKNVRELDRSVILTKPVVSCIYDREQGIVCTKIDQKAVRLSPVGSGTEWFFFKSKTPSLFWTFPKYYPKNGRWRAEQQLEILYSTEEIEGFIENHEKLSTRLLTLEESFATMKVSK